MRTTISIVLLVMATLVAIARADDRPTLDPPAIQKLSQPERLAQIVKVLRWRESQLQNFSLELVETGRNVIVKDGSSAGNEWKNQFELIRVEGRIFLHNKRIRTAGESSYESFAATDGAITRQYTVQSVSGRLNGRISPTQRFVFPYGAYFQFLGFNAQTVPDMTLAQWIEVTAANPSEKFVVDTEKVADQGELVVLKATTANSPVEQTFWFDPTRDGLPVRYDFHVGRDGSWARDRVTESRQANGFWIPTKVVKRSGNGAAPPTETEIVSEASRFDRGGVKPADTELKFPSGMTVDDGIRNIRYRIRPDGTELIFPTRDPQTGRYILDGSLPKPRVQPANPQARPTTQMSAEARDLQYRRQMMAEMQARRDQAAAQVTPDFIATIRSTLESNPREAVDKLNQQWINSLQQARRFDEIEELIIAASIAVSRDTGQLEQLQRNRARSLTLANKPKEALAAAKALYNVCGMGSVPDNLDLLAQCLRSANPTDPGIVNRFKLQQLAGAQTDANLRAKALEPLGQPILAGIQIDPKPFEKAIEERKQKAATDFNSLYSIGNLLLLSGRVKEARDAFEKAFAVAPPTELNYAAEGLAKLIKAEDGTVGRANAWALSIRPKE
jgi:tetratricopeptide (TPR) repeat protein